MTNPTEFIPIGIDLGSLHARVAIGNVKPKKNSGEGYVDTVPLPDIISNAQGSRYTLALVGFDSADIGEEEENIRFVFGEAARRALARENKPPISKDPSSTVRELVRSGSSMTDGEVVAEKAASAAAFFSHLADLACDACSSHHSKLRTIVSVPVSATPDEQLAIVDAVERGFADALFARLTSKEAKIQRKKNEEEPFVMGVITDPAAVCVAHGLTEIDRNEVIDFAFSEAQTTPSSWKHALVIDWGASGLTVSHISKICDTSSLVTIVRHVTEPSCSGTAIVSALASHCASMFERKSRVSGVLDSKKAYHRLELACESAVRSLARAPTVTVAVDGLFEGMDMSVPISRPRFEMLLSGIMQKAEKLLQTFAQEESVEFDLVLLAGNVCDMPSASNLIRKKLFPTANSGRGDVPPDEAIAIGCARHAAALLSCDTHNTLGGKRLEGNGIGPSNRKVKVCPTTIGICMIENTKVSGDMHEIISNKSIPIIEKGQPLPANVTKIITCSTGGNSWLTTSCIAIVQIQDGITAKSKVIGKIESIPLDEKSFEITVELSSIGELSLSVNGGQSATLS